MKLQWNWDESQAAKIVLLRPGDVYFFSGGTAHTVPFWMSGQSGQHYMGGKYV